MIGQGGCLSKKEAGKHETKAQPAVKQKTCWRPVGLFLFRF
ncbi:hypothetical protein GA8_05030 [Geobacillus sp. A8]|nr:hypothetical protein GA8_05030 [Geobacillus sp. A8]